MLTTLVFLLAAFAPVQRRPLPLDDLRPALTALREGKPGTANFDAALSKLPEMLESGASDLVRGAAYIAGEYKRVECAQPMIDALKRENARSMEAPDLATGALLDGLIRVGARGPLDVLFGRQDSQFSPQVYVLASNTGERRLDAMDRLIHMGGWELSDAYWAAASALKATALTGRSFCAVSCVAARCRRSSPGSRPA